MKILYVKNNSERAKSFQLQTIIYEDNNQKFVKKKALCKEAIPHLKQMKENYKKLNDTIINPKIKLAKIIDESEDSLTFEFIDGVSLEKKFNEARRKKKDDSNKIIQEYKNLISTGFETTKFNSNIMITDELKNIFGNYDYSQFNGELCFNYFSNIDLIFSNIIFKNENIYLIDYEWCYQQSLPLSYILYRALNVIPSFHSTKYFNNTLSIFQKMETNFIYNYVTSDKSFLQQQHYFLKNRISIAQQIQEKEQQIQEKEQQIQQLHSIAQSMRLKNRFKRLMHVSKLKKLMKLVSSIRENPQVLKKAFYYAKKGDFSYLFTKTKEKLNENLQLSNNHYFPYRNFFTLFDKEKFSLKDKTVDIIIPVYNGFEFLEPLFTSIKNHTFSNYRLIVVNDASPDERVKPFLQTVLKEFDFVFIENKQNLGFVKSVNNAMKQVKNHFVILNTDTEVPTFWLERLMYPIIYHKNIASTTPFSNAGTIASFPNFLEDNTIFENLSVEKLDQYFKTIDTTNFYEEIPTGVGFCMGVNYNLVQEIGFFDEETFNKGYGEENDWCQRAIQYGYKNILIPNLFIYHKHGGSFLSEDKKRYIEENLLKLIKKHPNYQKDIDLYIKKNPHEILRNVLILLISSKQNEGIHLIFDHMLGGGANSYRDKLIQNYRQDGKKTLKLLYDFYTNQYKLSYWYKDFEIDLIIESFQELKSLLLKLNIKEIFVNELVSFSNVYDILDFIQEIKKIQNPELIIPIHDYYAICPSYTLLNDRGEFCNIPSLQQCKSCMAINKLEWKTMFKGAVNIELWQEKWSKLLSNADKILCFSHSSKSLILKAYPLLNIDSITVIPHTIEPLEPIEKNIKTNSTKVIGVLGAINYAKGAQVLKELVETIEKNNLDMHVVLIGELSESIKSNKFTLTGRYKRKDLPKIIASHEIDIFFIPSIWPETFSYTTQEIMSMKMPLMVFDLGAPAERVKYYSKGIVLKDMKINTILNEVLKIS